LLTKKHRPVVVLVFYTPQTKLAILLNPFKSSGIKWLQFKVFRAILV